MQSLSEGIISTVFLADPAALKQYIHRGDQQTPLYAEFFAYLDEADPLGVIVNH